MSFLLRPASKADLSSAAALESAVFAFPRTEDQFLREADDGLHFTAVALEEGSGLLCGYASLTHILDEGYISNIAVAPEFRRHGIGDALLQALDAKAAELSLSFISLEVRSSNTPAIALYQKNGYQITGTLKNHYASPTEDALIMTKLFTLILSES